VGQPVGLAALTVGAGGVQEIAAGTAPAARRRIRLELVREGARSVPRGVRPRPGQSRAEVPPAAGLRYGAVRK